jgi:energy-coupling factor transport system permease protein
MSAFSVLRHRTNSPHQTTESTSVYKYLYINANTFFHRLDPRVKMLVVLAHYILLALWVRQLFLMVVLVIETLVLAGLSRSLVNLKSVLFVMAIVFVSGEISWILIGRGSTPLIGPLTLEPFLQGLSTAIRADAGIIISIVFLSTTRNEEIALGLVRMGLPFRAGFALSSALRMAPLLIAMTSTVAEAQRTRGLDLESGGLVQRLRRYVPLLVPAFLSTTRSVDQFAMAIEARGFGYQPQRGSYLQLQVARADYVAAGAAIVSIVVGVVIAVTGWGVVFNL